MQDKNAGFSVRGGQLIAAIKAVSQNERFGLLANDFSQEVVQIVFQVSPQGRSLKLSAHQGSAKSEVRIPIVTATVDSDFVFGLNANTAQTLVKLAATAPDHAPIDLSALGALLRVGIPHTAFSSQIPGVTNAVLPEPSPIPGGVKVDFLAAESWLNEVHLLGSPARDLPQIAGLNLHVSGPSLYGVVSHRNHWARTPMSTISVFPGNFDMNVPEGVLSAFNGALRSLVPASELINTQVSLTSNQAGEFQLSAELSQDGQLKTGLTMRYVAQTGYIKSRQRRTGKLPILGTGLVSSLPAFYNSMTTLANLASEIDGAWVLISSEESIIRLMTSAGEGGGGHSACAGISKTPFSVVVNISYLMTALKRLNDDGSVKEFNLSLVDGGDGSPVLVLSPISNPELEYNIVPMNLIDQEDFVEALQAAPVPARILAVKQAALAKSAAPVAQPQAEPEAKPKAAATKPKAEAKPEAAATTPEAEPKPKAAGKPATPVAAQPKAKAKAKAAAVEPKPKATTLNVGDGVELEIIPIHNNGGTPAA